MERGAMRLNVPNIQLCLAVVAKQGRLAGIIDPRSCGRGTTGATWRKPRNLGADRPQLAFAYMLA